MLSETAASGPVEHWTTRKLVELIPNSTKSLWLQGGSGGGGWVRELEDRGALVRRGKGWLGRRADIVAALASKPEPARAA
jgi:hypothetical protein